MRCEEKVSAFESALRRLALLATVGCLALAGCNGWFDQSELARDKGERLVRPILPAIDPIDEAETEFAKAEDVRQQDLQVIATDYVIGRNDLVTVSIFDLTAGGVETVRSARVSETGMLMLPMLSEPVKAAGLTEFQLQKSIAQKYKDAGILERAQVTVTITEALNRTFSILGAVMRPGRYVIREADFRVLNALVEAGDVSGMQLESLYIIRKLSAERPTTQPSAEDVTAPTTAPTTPPDLTPRSEAAPEAAPPLVTLQDVPEAPAPTTRPARAGDEGKTYTLEGHTMRIGAEPGAAARTPAAESPALRTTAVPSVQPAYDFGAALRSDEDERVIRVPLHMLRTGDLRYNVVIRPGDTIIIPVPNQGFYYIGGHVGAPGVYNLTGQKITLKQAVIGARMLDALAVPTKTDVIRRVGNNELYVRVNLAKVFEGKQPDIYLKPNDAIVVGTDFYPPFLAAIRGAFRLTYGFGFLYDRNYAPAQEGLRGF